MKAFGKRIIIIILAVLICISAMVTVGATNAKKHMEKEQAKQTYDRNRECFALDWEQLEKHMEKHAPEDVLFAASMVKSFDKKFEDVYALLDKGKEQKQIADDFFYEKFGAYPDMEKDLSHETHVLIENDPSMPSHEEIATAKAKFDKNFKPSYEPEMEQPEVTGRTHENTLEEAEKNSKQLSKEETKQLKEKYDREHPIGKGN